MDALIKSPSPHDIVRVAAASATDIRTVKAWITGRPMRSTTRARVEGALRALGFLRAEGAA